MKAIIKKENLIGKYLPFEQQTELPLGSIASGLNMLRKGLFGGWKPRKGYTLINTSATGAEIISLHRYVNPHYGDFHLFAQMGAGLYSLSTAAENLITASGELITTADGEILLVTVDAKPLDQRVSLGSSLKTVGETPGFSCVVGTNWIYADGSSRPLIYGGIQPFCDGFMVYDGATGSYVDYTDKVVDASDTSYGVVTAHADTVYYVGMKERGTAITLNVKKANTAAVTATVKTFRSGSWTDVSATDGTKTTNTHDTSGSLSWASSSDDIMTVLGNRQLYWYQVSFSGAPTEIEVSSCWVEWPISHLTNKWDGAWRSPSGALFYDHSATEYIDKLGSVTDDAQSTYMDISSMQIEDYIYVKTVERVLGFGFTMVEDNINTAAQKVDLIECMTSAGWASVGAFTDKTLDSTGTKSFAQTGTLWITNAYSPQESTLLGDDTPGYWYRISLDGALSATVQVAEIYYASWPETLNEYTGCVEFLGKLALWGDVRYANRLLLSDYDRPDFLCNTVERYSPPFGAIDPILNCAVVGDYIVVYKERGIFLWDGAASQPLTVSSSIGIASSKSLAIISSGDRTLKENESRLILMHQNREGVYKLAISGSSFLMTKVDEQIRNYFLPAESEYIGDVHITNLQACYEKTTDTYRLFLPDRVLAYSIGTMEWLPPWEYELVPNTMLDTIGPDDEHLVVAGTNGGFIQRMELVASDRDSSNAEVAIEHKLKTRPIYSSVENIPAITGLLRKTWLELATDSGTITYKLYKNHATSGAEVAEPDAASLIESGKSVKVQRFDHSLEDTICFQAELISNTIGQQMEVYSITYQLEQIRTVI